LIRFTVPLIVLTSFAIFPSRSPASSLALSRFLSLSLGFSFNRLSFVSKSKFCK